MQTGDSGAPMMVENSGSLTLVGINWFIGDSNNNSLNGFSYGNYSGEIESFINANPVPELSATESIALFYHTCQAPEDSLLSNSYSPSNRSHKRQLADIDRLQRLPSTYSVLKIPKKK